MRVWIVSDGEIDKSAYIDEMFRMWGLALAETVGVEALQKPVPDDVAVVIADGNTADTHASALVAYARAGGCVVAFAPEGEFARQAGLDIQGQKENHCRLRLVRPAAGLRGQQLPIPGKVLTYACQDTPTVWGYVFELDRCNSESPAIIARPVGKGNLVVFSFDLPAGVSLLRQGDPALADRPTEGVPYPRPERFAVDVGGTEWGWTPCSDMLARLLVDVVRHYCESYGPMPMLWQLPDMAPAILLFSGDEDHRPVDLDFHEMHDVEAMGGTMTLYIVPHHTEMTPEIRREMEARGHTISVHPDITKYGDQPVQQQLQALRDEVELFIRTQGEGVRTIRNHALCWPGYMEMIRMWEEMGIRMSSNLASASLEPAESRDWRPYGQWGSALPSRFVGPDGDLINVWEQYVHMSDDGGFHPTSYYSAKLSSEQWEVLVERIFEDSTRFFHVPFCVVIHPCNYAEFSGPHARALMKAARRHNMPIWSIDRWCDFWEARDTYRLGEAEWNGTDLTFTVTGGTPCGGLSVILPPRHEGSTLGEVVINGRPASVFPARRFGKEAVHLPLAHEATTHHVVARYGSVTDGVTDGTV